MINKNKSHIGFDARAFRISLSVIVKLSGSEVKMEQLNYPAEDFFANGFHQFYNELNGDLVYESAMDYGTQIFNNFEPPVKSYDGVWTTVDENSSNDLFYEELTSSTYFKVEPNEADLIDLDQFLSFDGDLNVNAGTVSFLDPFDSLPEKTFMCNDSCNLFLKESSENLKLNSFNLQQEQANQIHEASEVVEEKPVFPCEYGDCQKVYAKPAHLRAHLRRHLGKNLF